MDRDTREYFPSDWESVSKVGELEAEVAKLKAWKEQTEHTGAINSSMEKEIAELKRSYQILCDKYDAMEMCDNKIGADAIQEMVEELPLKLRTLSYGVVDILEYADKLRGKQSD